MESYNPEAQRLLNVIELLNDWGYNIVEIDNTLYIVEVFDPKQKEISEHHELVGQNITTWVHNQTQTKGLTKQARMAMQQQLATLPNRRRKFSGDLKWKEYVSQQGHNV